MAKGRKTGGRLPGSKNKVTVAALHAIDLAFEGIGGVPALQEWAGENRADFYRLWSKRIPQKIEGPASDGAFIIRIERPTP